MFTNPHARILRLTASSDTGSARKHSRRTLTRAAGNIRPRRIAAVTVLAAATAGLAGPALAQTGPALAQTGPASPRPGVTGHSVIVNGPSAKAAARIAGYWTRSRMLSARNAGTLTIKPGAGAPKPAPPRPSGPTGKVAGTAPTQVPAGGIRPVPGHLRPLTGSSGSPWTGNFYQPPATTTGKVFYTTTAGGQTRNWVCSASTVNSNGKNVVFTAGHCVYGSIGGKVPGEGWHSNWVFVPDYYNGYAPYGVWTARQLWTLTSYINTGGSLADEGDDIGAAVMNTNGYGQHIVNVVGGQGIMWNQPANEYVFDFGYPAAAPFSGSVLDYCTGWEYDGSFVAANTMDLSCNFTGGSSGGPWLAYFNGQIGYVNGVNDATYPSQPNSMFAGYFGNNAANLFGSVANL